MSDDIKKAAEESAKAFIEACGILEKSNPGKIGCVLTFALEVSRAYLALRAEGGEW